MLTRAMPSWESGREVDLHAPVHAAARLSGRGDDRDGGRSGGVRDEGSGCVARCTCGRPDAVRRLVSSRASGTLNPGINPSSLAVAELNGDGAADLAVATYGTVGPGAEDHGGVTLLFGDGAGGVRARSSLAMDRASSVLAGDLTADGRTDLVVASADRDDVTVFAGDGRGGFESVSSRTVAVRPVLRAIADFNGDGRPDLLLTDSSPLGPYGRALHLWLGDGAGGFLEAPASPVTLDGEATSVVVGDLDGDGHADVAASLLEPSALEVLLSDGTGRLRKVNRPEQWADREHEMLATQACQLALGDFNRDGRADLAISVPPLSEITVLAGDGSGHFRELERARRPYAEGPGPFLTADFNADGTSDMAVMGDAMLEESPEITVLRGDGHGGFYDAPGSPEQPAWSSASGAVLTAGDVNGDQAPDLLVLTTPYADSGELLVLLNSAGRPRRHERIPIHDAAPRLSSTQPDAGSDYDFDLGPNRVRFGARVTLRAYVMCEPGALVGRALALYRRLATGHRWGRWHRIAERTTGRHRRVRAGDRPFGNAEYQWRAADRRRPRLRRAPAVDITVAPAISVAPEGNTLVGHVTPPLRGRVELQQSNGEGQDEEEWATVASRRLRRGRFAFVISGLGRGQFRVLLPASRRLGLGLTDRIAWPPG